MRPPLVWPSGCTAVGLVLHAEALSRLAGRGSFGHPPRVHPGLARPPREQSLPFPECQMSAPCVGDVCGVVLFGAAELLHYLMFACLIVRMPPTCSKCDMEVASLKYNGCWPTSITVVAAAAMVHLLDLITETPPVARSHYALEGVTFLQSPPKG
jgi:hypothetical protein